MSRYVARWRNSDGSRSFNVTENKLLAIECAKEHAEKGKTEVEVAEIGATRRVLWTPGMDAIAPREGERR